MVFTVCMFMIIIVNLEKHTYALLISLLLLDKLSKDVYMIDGIHKQHFDPKLHRSKVSSRMSNLQFNSYLIRSELH